VRTITKTVREHIPEVGDWVYLYSGTMRGCHKVQIREIRREDPEREEEVEGEYTYAVFDWTDIVIDGTWINYLEWNPRVGMWLDKWTSNREGWWPSLNWLTEWEEGYVEKE
jgi:hypothetical protein